MQAIQMTDQQKNKIEAKMEGIRSIGFGMERAKTLNEYCRYVKAMNRLITQMNPKIVKAQVERGRTMYLNTL